MYPLTLPYLFFRLSQSEVWRLLFDVVIATFSSPNCSCFQLFVGVLVPIWKKIQLFSDPTLVLHPPFLFTHFLSWKNKFLYRCQKLSYKKEYIWVNCNKVYESRTYYTKWNKSDKENKQILYINAYIWNLDVQAGFRKGRVIRDQIANIWWIIKKMRVSFFSKRKPSTSALLTMPKPLIVWITENCGKFWKTWECQTTWSASWEICIQVKKQQLELDMEQETGSKSGKGVRQGYIFSPWMFNLYAEYIRRNAGLDESQAGIKIAGRNINNLIYADDTTLKAESEEELKSLLMKVKK